MTKQILQRYGLAIVPVALLVILLAFILHKASYTPAGDVVYPLDDTYIHMALAKNLAFHGHWNLSGAEMQGASSSPLWTLLLAGIFRLGAPEEITPLAVNFLFAVLVIVAVFWAANRCGWPRYLTVVVSLAIVAWSPLAATVFASMEHAMQILFTFLLFTLAGEFVARGKPAAREPLPWRLMALALLCAATRYESAFLIFAICVLLLLQKRWIPIFGICVAAVIPIVAYAAYSLAHGGLWAPSSVLTKGMYNGGFNYSVGGFDLLRKLTLTYPLHDLFVPGSGPFPLLPPAIHLTCLIVAAWALYFACRKRSPPVAAKFSSMRVANDSGYLLAIWFITLWLHLNFAKTGWYYRYEAYLIVQGLFVLGALVAPKLPQSFSWSILSGWSRSARMITGVVLIALAAVMSARGVRAVVKSPVASRNIQEQSLQVANFLGEYYREQPVVLNDIGAVGLYSNVDMIDLTGLGSSEIARELIHRTLNTAAIEKICAQKQGQIAVLYPGQFDRLGGFPANWIPVGSWTIRDNYVLGADEMIFYALNPAQVDSLRAHLQEFTPKLPASVKIEIFEPSANHAAKAEHADGK